MLIQTEYDSCWLLVSAQMLEGLSNPRLLEQSTDGPLSRMFAAAIEGEIEIQNRRARLQILLNHKFPHTGPIFKLVPPFAFGKIPHIESGGFLCLFPNDGLYFDFHNPKGIVQDSFERAMRILNDGICRENEGDWLDEFEIFWQRCVALTPKELSLPFLSQAVPCHISPSDNIKRIQLVCEPTGRPLFFHDIGYNGVFSETFPFELEKVDAVYIPFKPGTQLSFPGIESWSPAKVRQLISMHCEGGSSLRELLDWRPKKHEYVVFGLPRPSGGVALFGVLFAHHDEAKESLHPLVSENSLSTLSHPFSLGRLEREYLLPRGGGNGLLQEKKVAVVGCGSVGGFVALELARAGVGKICLVDHEFVEPSNIYRHVSGLMGLRNRKVQALKREIEHKIPFTSVEIEPVCVENVLRRKLPGDFELVVVALGEPNLELRLNQFFVQSSSTSVLYTWLEPYGIGGHALLSNNGGKGCFECLYSKVEGQQYPQNRAAFAAPGQDFTKTLVGCGDFFTPYGSVHALKTAALATELALSCLLGDEKKNPLLSWKGSDLAFTKQGFQTSPRYSLSSEELFDLRYRYHDPQCSVCST